MQAPIFAQLFAAGRIYWKNPRKKGGLHMDIIYSHGDVDDLIYQEEWTASER